MSFRLIEAEKAQHAISRLCSVLGVTRAGYYAWRRRGPSLRFLGDAELAQLIERIFDGSLKTYGAPRIHAELAAEYGIRVGRKRVARLMRRLGIEGVSRRGKRRRTTVAHAAAAPAPDLVERRFEAAAPNALWLADITYIPTYEGWLFLAAVVDCFSRRVVGWSMRDDLRAELVVDALGMALARRRPQAGLVHHSDRGSQYTSLAFGKTLRESGLLASMGSRGDAYDNALAESFISTIKCELIKRQTWKSRDEARLAVFRYIETFYNPRRRHSALGYRSPVDYELEYERMKEDQPTNTLEAAIAA
jgi:putative transposase